MPRANPRRQPAAGNGLTSHCIGTHRLTSPYLDQPQLPLAVALPRMLEKIETELAAGWLGASKRGGASRQKVVRFKQP
jgi:hypothetical protein